VVDDVVVGFVVVVVPLLLTMSQGRNAYHRPKIDVHRPRYGIVGEDVMWVEYCLSLVVDVVVVVVFVVVVVDDHDDWDALLIRYQPLAAAAVAAAEILSVVIDVAVDYPQSHYPSITWEAQQAVAAMTTIPAVAKENRTTTTIVVVVPLPHYY